MTRLGKVVRARTLAPNRPNPDTGRDEIWYAESADGLWLYERVEETGTPWVVTFTPTGQEEWLGSLPAARRWTASGDALVFLRRRAQDVVDAGGRRNQVRYPLNDYGKPYRYVEPEDPADCAARVAEARHQIERIEEVMSR